MTEAFLLTLSLLAAAPMAAGRAQAPAGPDSTVYQLDPASRRLFRAMWLPDSSIDPRGAFDIPIMGSPACASVLEYLGAFGRPMKKHVFEWILDDIFMFACGAASRPRGLDIALGFCEIYPAWAQQVRGEERERKAERRMKTFSLREDES